MTAEIEHAHYFYSPRFGIDPAEVDETNPYLFGRELADWFSDQLRQKGYDTEVIAEDWGWCVICQHSPYLLFVGCVSALDNNLIERCKNPASNAQILWQTIPFVEMSLLQRIGNSEDMEPAFQKLCEDVRSILGSEPSVRFATEQEIQDWENDVGNLVDERVSDNCEPKPLSRWITVPVSLLLLPVLLISAVGAGSLLFDNPEEYAVIRPVVGIILLFLIFLLGTAIIKMILGKKGSSGGLFPAFVLRGFAIVFFALPIGGLFNGWYVDHPVTGTAQAIAYLLVAVGLWRLANRRKARLADQQDSTAA